MPTPQQEVDYDELALELLLPYEVPGGKGEIELPDRVKSYLEIMKNGMGEGTSTPKRIVVIGAGIAGMFAAKLLKDYGHHVSVVEANDSRVGGRIKTFRGKEYFEDDKQYGEAGAMRFPKIHPLLNAYIDDLGYDFVTQEFYLVDVDKQGTKLNERWIRCNSFQQSKKDYQDPSKMAQGFEIAPPSASASDLLKEALNKVRDLFSKEENNKRVNKYPREDWLAGWAQVIEQYDKYSMRGYLEQETDLSPEQIDYIGTLENLTSRMPLAFMHSFLGRSDINVDVEYRELKGGSDALTDKLYVKLLDLGVSFHMDHRVTHIEYYDPEETPKHANPSDPISIRSITENGAINSHITADLAIVTVPFSSLRFVRITPHLSYHKRRAIMELHYDAATKVLLEFSERWWEFSKEKWSKRLKEIRNSGSISQVEFERYLKLPSPETSTRGGGSITDNPNRFMYYPSHRVDGSEGGVILASYTWADDARRWDSMNDDDRYAFALRGMRLLHGDRIELFYTGRGATQSWAQNPYAFGEAAVFQPGQMTRLHLATQTVEGPLHFAGEHTSLKHAWVEGSLESACRVALEIKALDNVGE